MVNPYARIVRLGSGGQTPSKFRNKPTLVEGIRFDSKKEAERYRQLKLLEAGGWIRNLQRQVTYALKINGLLICRYRADFEYEEAIKGEWRKVTEDVKGQTSGSAYGMFMLKKKLMRALHGIEIREA